jgi:hypothetical protein
MLLRQAQERQVHPWELDVNLAALQIHCPNTRQMLPLGNRPTVAAPGEDRSG